MTPITSLKPNEIFVFGSNLAGRHGCGAAKTARELFGAEHGVGKGPTGRCYAIPTKNEALQTLPLAIINQHVADFLVDAWFSQGNNVVFLLTPIGCGLAGYHPGQIAPMFHHAPANVILPREFKEVLLTNGVHTWVEKLPKK